MIGYAYDPSLLITTDGGQSWTLHDRVGISSLEAAGGTIAKVVSKTQGCGGMATKVVTAPVGTTRWRTLPAPPIYGICPPVLYRQGVRLVLVVYGNAAGGVRATAQIARSADGGRTWTAVGPDQCGGRDGYASGIALAPSDVLVLLCQHQMPDPSGHYAPAWVRISADGGATFGPDQTVPSLTGTPKGTVVLYHLAAASSSRILVTETGSTDSKLLRTENGGRTWSIRLTFPGTAPVLLVGFEDPLTARVAQADTVWTTASGGRTWRADKFTAR
ncbi:MAG TPA: sialidase family protein [Streptosporangiaceae bacterium]|nr:sialidase family protein [Streptosporangiaceae bacterium]